MDQVQHQQKNTSFELEWLERKFSIYFGWLISKRACICKLFSKEREIKEIVLKLAYSRDSRRRGFASLGDFRRQYFALNVSQKDQFFNHHGHVVASNRGQYRRSTHTQAFSIHKVL